MKKKRSPQQNRALHLLFRLMAEELNRNGWTVQKTLRQDFELWWTETLIKELIWRELQEAMFGTRSTTELTTEQINKTFEVINRQLGEKYHLHIPFPSLDALIEYQEEQDRLTKKNKGV